MSLKKFSLLMLLAVLLTAGAAAPVAAQVDVELDVAWFNFIEYDIDAVIIVYDEFDLILGDGPFPLDFNSQYTVWTTTLVDDDDFDFGDADHYDIIWDIALLYDFLPDDFIGIQWDGQDILQETDCTGGPQR